jgi:HEAT repeat protein
MALLKTGRISQVQGRCRIAALVCLFLVGFTPVGPAQTRQTRPVGKKVDRIPELITQLASQNLYMRIEAANALGEAKDPRAVMPLVAALKDTEYSVQTSAADALGKIGAPAVQPLIAALRGAGLDEQICADRALGAIGKPAVEPLIAALKDTDANVRLNAAHSLGMTQDTRAVEPLIAILDDKDPGTRSNAVSALGDIKDPRAVEPLIAELKDTAFYIPGAAAEALGKIGPPSVEPLIAALQDADRTVRDYAARALGEIKDPRAVLPLIAALKDSDDYVRDHAAEALGKTGAPAVEPLIAALKDPDANARKKAGEALAEIADPRVAEPLLAASRERNTAAVAGAHVFFIQRGEPGTEDVLIEALNDFGDQFMAADYLNSGNQKLSDAASAWASRNNFEVRSMHLSGDKSVGWGSKP